MFVRRIGFSLSLALVGAAVLVALVGWTGAQAASPPRAVEGALQQTMPMTETMPMTGSMPMDHAMPAPGAEHADHAVPAQPAAVQGGMGAMMANMAKMQGMMARMQRMMAGGMMGESMPMSGTMPMAGMMGGDMGEMMDMMAEMQGMMADMQGMMAGEMMAGDMPMGGKMQGGQMQGGMPMGGQMQGGQMQGGMPMGGQMQGQQMQGGMMGGQMPMMGTVIIVAPMPMGGMMGQMPMMQGMMSGGMMQGMDMGGMMGQGAAAGQPGMAGPAAAIAGRGEQGGKLDAIDVKVTPPDLSNIQGDTIDFTVDLNATGADLGLELAALATLKIGDHAMPATAWTVKLDHGHHVNGVLSFPAHMSGPVESATLTITDPAGGAALDLTWPAAE